MPPRRRKVTKKTAGKSGGKPKVRALTYVKQSDAERYRQKLVESNATNLLRSVKGREIGGEEWGAEGPSAEELELREACRLDLRLFLESYFPKAFPLAWSEDHVRVIARIQTTIIEGGTFALAMPRGSGKTSILERAAIWALLYRHKRYVAVIAAKESLGEKILKSIKKELQGNQRLRRPFREVCYPIRKLEGEPRKANGQLFAGERTQIGWKDGSLVLPTMPDEACPGANPSGGAVVALGITGGMRGLKDTLADGTVIRPDLVLLDDPQTRESAMSALQTENRLDIIKGDILGLVGPGEMLAAFCACTVIRDGDLADQLLNRDHYPEWQGDRTAAVYAWPTNEDLWERYVELRREGYRTGEGTGKANAFYEQHQAAMDAGAQMAWPARHPGASSAVQWAMNERLKLGERGFAAEYQNAPIRADTGAVKMLTAMEIAARVNAFGRGIIPSGADHVTAFIDVGDTLLHWAVAAWSSDFSGWIAAYGVYPDQGSSGASSARKAVRTLADMEPKAGPEGALRAGLLVLIEELLSREWQREDGSLLRVERLLVDSSYLPDVVHGVCREVRHAALMPSRGRFVGVKHVPMDEFAKRPGEKLGHRWHIPVPAKGRSTRAVAFDSNYWKSFVHARYATAIGDPGALTLYGKDPRVHQVFADHQVAEVATRITANGRTVDEWQVRPGAENHWFDCIIGCAVGASMAGAALAAATIPRKPRPAPVSFQELRKQAGTAGPQTLAQVLAARKGPK